MIEIRELRGRAGRREFVRVAPGIYPAGSPWVRPLDETLRGYLDPARNPFSSAGEFRPFLALRDGRPMGRVLAHVWQRHHRLHDERAGYFGFFECGDDREAAAGLLDAAAAYVRDRGCTTLLGPFNMTAAQEMGVVVSGFEQTPSIDMIYTPPWYPRLLEAAGLSPCFRMQTWRNDDVAALDPEALLSAKHRALGGENGINMRIRTIDSRRRDEDLEHFRELTNSAFLGNWGFVPITRQEWQFQVGPVVPMLDPALMLLAEVHGVPIGCTFAVPDFNQVLKRTNGRLLHPAALALLRRPPTDAAVIILLAVRKSYQGLGVSRALNVELLRALRRGGYRGLSITWISTENRSSLAQAEALGMHRLHELAMYERAHL